MGRTKSLEEKQRSQRRRVEGAEAMKDYRAEELALRQLTSRLRAERFARDVDDFNHSAARPRRCGDSK
jgi:hypothetical protein